MDLLSARTGEQQALYINCLNSKKKSCIESIINTLLFEDVDIKIPLVWVLSMM